MAAPRPPLDPAAVVGSQGGSHRSPGHLGRRPAVAPPSWSPPAMRRSGDPMCPWRPLQTAPELWGKGCEKLRPAAVRWGEPRALGSQSAGTGAGGPANSTFQGPSSVWVGSTSARFPSDLQARRRALWWAWHRRLRPVLAEQGSLLPVELLRVSTAGKTLGKKASRPLLPALNRAQGPGRSTQGPRAVASQVPCA